MARNARLTLIATAAVVFLNSAAYAGGANSYNTSVSPVMSHTAPVSVQPQIEPYYAASPVVANAPSGKEGYYDPSRGNNQDFGYEQSFACGGALDGAQCLVIQHDHMRRVRLEREAGTILVGNPTIADVTVLGKDTIFVSARSIGSTNIIILDENNNEITTFEVFVREPKTKRVILRNAGLPETYQCAPDCLRALAQSDAPESHSVALGVVSSDIGLDQTSIGLQSGSNPNIDAAIPVTPVPSFGPAPSAGGGAPNPGAAAANGLVGNVGQLGDAVGPAAAALGALMGGGASLGGVSQPVNTAPPPPILN